MINDSTKLEDLLGRLCNGNLAQPEFARLSELLKADALAREFYIEYLDAHLTMVDHARRSHSETSPALPTEALPTEALPTETAEGGRPEPRRADAGSKAPTWRRRKPRYLTAALAASLLLSVAGVALLDKSFDDGNASAGAMATSGEPEKEFAGPAGEPLYVAQVTDLTSDVTWGEKAASQEFLLRVRRGDRVAISTGLVQLDYFSGAQIILKAPCAFVPTGESSGRLEYGSLTGQVSVGDFVLTTPTAKVIDLGTEFGVSVDGIEGTDVCVFDGEVHVLAGLSGHESSASVVLREGMKARVARGGEISELPELDIRGFTRQLPLDPGGVSQPGQLSLVDLFSGSVSGRVRLAGVIAPDTGESDRHPWLRVDGPGYSVANNYCTTLWHPFVDGVFIPTEAGVNTQLDSLGHAVNLPQSTGRTWGPIWSRRRLPKTSQIASQEDNWGTDTLEGVIARLANCKTGMIGIHANVGVTFDLEKVRRQTGRSIESFQTVVGNLDNSMTRLPEWAADKRFTADVRVFVDGDLRASRLDFGRVDGELELRAKLTPADRYLTVVCTDASRGEVSGHDAYDHVVLIDPVLSLYPR